MGKCCSKDSDRQPFPAESPPLSPIVSKEAGPGLIAEMAAAASADRKADPLKGSESAKPKAIPLPHDNGAAVKPSEGEQDSSDEDEPAVTKKTKKTSKILPKVAFNEAHTLEDELRRLLMPSGGNEARLDGLGLSELPRALLSPPYGHLTAIDAHENSLTEVPNEIGTLTKLRSLHLSSNRLTTLPESIGLLVELESLFLDHNMLTGLPDSVGKLTKLTRVGLEWNDLRLFPECLMKLHNLHELYLSENEGITALPDVDLLEWQNFTNLTLKMDNNPSLVASSEDIEIVTEEVKIVWNKIYPDKVFGQMYLGSLRSAQSLKVYQDLGIGYVLTCGRDLSVLIPPGMEQLELIVDDTPDSDMSSFFAQAHEFIEKQNKTNKGILVHCFAGLSRSATVVASYLMKYRGMRRDDAIAFIKKARPSIHPNDGFMLQLQKYEQTLFGS